MADINMEIILKQNSDKIILPVLPENFELNTSYNHQKIMLLELGEANIVGNPNLKSMSVSSFFPAVQYDFLSQPAKAPYEYTELINKWAAKKIPVRLIITATDINILALIENFVYGERDSSRDVYYTLELSEYRFLNIKNGSGGLLSRPL